MKRDFKHKALSVLLALAMVLWLLPVTGFVDANADDSAVPASTVTDADAGQPPGGGDGNASAPDVGNTAGQANNNADAAASGSSDPAVITPENPALAEGPSATTDAEGSVAPEPGEPGGAEVAAEESAATGTGTFGTGVSSGDPQTENKIIDAERWDVELYAYGLTDSHLKYSYQPAVNGELDAVFQLIAADGISGSEDFSVNTRDWSDVWSILHNTQILPGTTAAIYGGDSTVNINNYTAFMDYVNNYKTTHSTYSSETYYEYLDGVLTPITVNTVINTTVYDLVLRKSTTTTLSSNGVTVSGAFEAGAALDAQSVAAASTGCEDIVAADDAGNLIALYDLLATGSYAGDLAVTVPVDAAYNGKAAAIIHHLPGGDEVVETTVAGGAVTGTFSSLSPFGVVLLGEGDENFAVGAEKYQTLAEAVAAVPGGGTVTMLQDVTITDDIMLTKNAAYTIDLGGHTLTGAGAGLGTLVVVAGNVTLRNGSMTAAFTDGIALQIFVGTVALENISINATTGSAAMPIDVEGGTLTIRSGEFRGGQYAVYCAGLGKVAVETGHFVSSGTSACLYQSGAGRISFASGSVASPANPVNLGTAKNVTVTRQSPAFQVGADFFYTLKDAVSAVPKDGTVTMLRDVTGASSALDGGWALTPLTNENYSFDLGGYTYTGNLIASINKVTVRNGTISGCLNVTGFGNATLDDLNIDGGSYAIDMGGGTVTILSGGYYGTTSAIRNWSGRVTISAGTFSNDPSSAVGCINNNGGPGNGGGLVQLAQGSRAGAPGWLDAAKEVVITHTDGSASGLVISGFDVTLDADCYGTGWSYDSPTRTLTVTGDITVTGAASGQTETLTIDIASGKTVNWQADYSGSGSGHAFSEGMLYFSGANGNVVFAGCDIQSGADGVTAIYSQGDVTINAAANIVYTGTNAHAVKAEGDLVMNGGYVCATADGSNAVAADRNLTILGGSVQAMWLAVQGGEVLTTISGGEVVSGQYAIYSWGDVAVSGGIVYGADEGIHVFADGANVTISGGLVLVDGEDPTNTVVCSGQNPVFTLGGSGIVAAFDGAQPEPFTVGTHTGLASFPADALTWALQDGNGGVAYGVDAFFDMGVTVIPAAPIGIPIDAEHFPDANFRAWLLDPANISGAGADALLTPTEIAGIDTLWLWNEDVASLTGLEHFTALKELYCINSQDGDYKLDILPALPSTLERLHVDGNNLTALPSLPAGLLMLSCDFNQIASLPELPEGLKWLYCVENSLVELPQLPAGLEALSCSNNSLTELPALPTSLAYLDCSANSLVAVDLSGLDALSTFVGDNQAAALTLSGNNSDGYTLEIALNAPTFGDGALAYLDGILTSTDSTVLSTSFEAATGRPDCLLFGTLNFSYQEGTEYYDVWANGERFSSDKLTIACGDGTAVYDPASSTLTLTNATIATGCEIPADVATTYCTSGIFTLVDLNVVLIGSNVIGDTGGSGIDSYAYDAGWNPVVSDISISGGGALAITQTSAASDGYGVYASGALSVNNVALYINCASTGLWAASSMQVTGSRVVINNTGAAYYGIVVAGGYATIDGSVLVGNRQPISANGFPMSGETPFALFHGIGDGEQGYLLQNGGMIITYDPTVDNVVAGSDTGILSAPAGIAVWDIAGGQGGAGGSDGQGGIAYDNQGLSGFVPIPGVTVGQPVDTPAPTGAISFGLHSWSSFLDTATFTLFVKEAQNLAITAVDDGGEPVTIEYFFSSSVLSAEEAAAIDEWTAYSDAFAIGPNNKYIVYARLTDVSGNTAIINSEGIVLYSDSVQGTASINYVKGSAVDVSAEVTLNGNTVAGVSNGLNALVAGTDYTVSGSSIMFAASYLEAFAASDMPYILTVSYNPLGETYLVAQGNAAPATTTLSLMVTDAPVPTYALTVVGGTGSGSYPAGAEVGISAGAPPAGKVFDSWAGGNGGGFADASSAATSFTMPPNAAWVMATYKDAPVETVPVSSIVVSGGASISTQGGTLQLDVTVLPANASNSSVIWASSDTSIATVDANGLVTAIGDGTVVITATAEDGFGSYGEATVTVTGQSSGGDTPLPDDGGGTPPGGGTLPPDDGGGTPGGGGTPPPDDGGGTPGGDTPGGGGTPPGGGDTPGGGTPPPGQGNTGNNGGTGSGNGAGGAGGSGNSGGTGGTGGGGNGAGGSGDDTNTGSGGNGNGSGGDTSGGGTGNAGNAGSAGNSTGNNEVPDVATPLDPAAAIDRAVGFPWWIFIVIGAAIVAGTAVFLIRRRSRKDERQGF